MSAIKKEVGRVLGGSQTTGAKAEKYISNKVREAYEALFGESKQSKQSKALEQRREREHQEELAQELAQLPHLRK